jgi:iron complex outermembrane receptor protein
MKLRHWFGIRACTGLTALLVTTSSTANAQSTLRMRPVRTRVAQAPQPTPPPSPAPAPDAAPPAAPTTDTNQPAPAPAPAAADEPVAPEPTPPTEGEVIVVTGSRIGDPLGKQAPVLMLTREDLDRTGLTSVGDMLQQLPVSGGAINGKFNSSGNFGFPPDGGGIGAGATEADLRYLGSKRVLVLVDGVRWVNGSSASGVAAATDLNTIPLAVVDRIEVLEDGASPIYGSDAIAGVINIITRKEFNGAVASAYTGGFTQGDGFTQKYDVSWGSTTPKLARVFSASFLDQRTVFSKDRALADSPIPTLENCEAGCSSATPQGRVVFKDPFTGTAQNLTLNEGVMTPRYPADYHDFASSDRFNFSPYNLVETPSQRLGAFSSVTYKLLPEINIRGKASFLNRQSVNQAAPEPLFIGPQAGNGNRMDAIKVDVTNPYNPFGFTFDPATDPTYVITRRPLEAGPRKFEQTVNTFYASGGFDGHFDVGKQRFTWDTTLAYGLNRAEQRRNNSFNSAKLEEALGPAFQADDGTWKCGTRANPGQPNCVPFNIFGGQAGGSGSITPEMLAFTTFTEHDVSEQTLVDAVGNVAGNLVKLPGGWLAAAAGVEFRRLSGFYEPDSVVAAGDGADVPSQPTSGNYNVAEAYAELRAPLVAGMPGIELLDVNAAARVSDYSFLSPEFTGKVGARWKPTKDLILRASYGSGFRAPSIGELFGAKSRFDATLTDPCSKFTRDEVSADTRMRCIALGVPADGSYEQLNPQISVATGGNPELKPETSTSFNLSAAFSPAALQDQSWVDSFDFELAYWNIKLDSAVSALDAQLQLDRCVAGEMQFCTGILRNPQGTIFSFNNALQNLGGINVRGLDLAITYRGPRKPFGRFRVTSQSSYLLAYEEKVPAAGGGFETVDRTGTIAGEPEHAYPRFKSALAIGWHYKQIELTFTTRYIHSLTEQCRDLADFPGTCSDPNPDDDTKSTNKLGATVYNDLQLLWAPQRELTITAGVNNMFDIDPPTCYSCSLNGFNGLTYDVPGIFGYLSATYHVQ